MTEQRFKLIPFVAVLLRKGNELLLIRRYNTGYDDGMYCCVGGGVDGNEPITDAAIREAKEELGITLKKDNLKVVHAIHYNSPYGEYIAFLVKATEWDGEPQIMEPHKCDDIRWFPMDALPENMASVEKKVLKDIENDVFYSEHGWK